MVKRLHKKKKNNRFSEQAKAPEKPRDNSLRVIIIVSIIAVVALGSLWFITRYNPNPIPEGEGNLLLNDETMVCDYQYICYKIDGQWHKYAYSSNTNLIIANKIKVENEVQIKQFFQRENLKIYLNSSDSASAEFSETLLSTVNIFHLYGYYFNTVKDEGRYTESGLYSDYNFSEPALLIFGPSLGAQEDSIKFDGMNVIVQGTTSENMDLLLGKLLLITIS